MSGKFDNIQLGREFRNYVKPRLKALAGWPAYMASQGWNGRSEALTRAEILAACEALGFDLHAAAADFASLPPVLGIGATAAIAAAARDALNDPSDAVNVAEDRRIEAMLAKDDAEPGDGGAGDDSEAGRRFEGGDVDTVIADILAPASPHMTPHLASMMPSLIRDAVAAAVRGPRTIVQTVVQVQSGDGAVVASPVTVKALQTLPLYRAFGLNKGDGRIEFRHVWNTLQVEICDHSDPLNPIDPDYVWQAEILAELASQDAAGMNAWLWGAAGTGKTDGCAQYAARLGRPFVRIAIERTTEPAELIGQMVPAKGGGMVWEDGKLTRAFRIPRAVILIDEPSLLRSGTLAVLQTALDHRKLYLVTGETVAAAPGIFIIAADNTNGTGDDSGRYVDTAPLNAAFLDRFALKTQVSFLSTALETTMVARRAGIHAKAVAPMVEYASLTRQNCDAGKLTLGVTTRRLLAWARLVRIGVTSAKAFEGVVIAGAAAEDKATLIMLAGQNLTTAHTTIDGVARGLIDPNAPAIDPHAQGGVGPTALQFPDDNETL